MIRKLQFQGLTPAVLLALALSGFGADFPEHPYVACSADELQLLQTAYAAGNGADFNVVAGMIRSADSAMAADIVFPPRGGQHNTFYQCTKCQIALKTVTDTLHKCPVCKKEYSGAPYDDVIFRRQHGVNLNRMLTTAWAYAVTHERRYAEFSAQILSGYAERYLEYPYHGSTKYNVVYNMLAGGRLYEQTLSEASALALQIAPAYDLIYDSGVLSEKDMEMVEEKLFRPMLANIAKYNTGINNWQSWHNAAMVSAGAVLQDTQWIQRGIDDPEHGFRFQLQHSLSSDGMWYESSWGYHFYALRALVVTAETGRRFGLNLWDSPELKAMFTLPSDYVMADGNLPRFGDDVGTKLSKYSGLMEYAYHAYRDPAFLPFLSSRPTRETIMFGRNASAVPEPPPPHSVLLKGAGHAILRTDGKAGLTAALTFGASGGYHGHFDKLSFVFFGFGRELGVDPGRAVSQAYRLPIHKDWYKATLSHNTVVVDGVSQAPAKGEAFLFGATPECAAVLAGCDTAYPNVKHRRLCVLFPEYMLVFDRLQASEEREFEWFYHNTGHSANSECAIHPYSRDGRSAGYSYIRNGASCLTNGCTRVAFEGEQGTTWVTINGQQGTRLFMGDGPFKSVQDRIPLAVFTRYGDKTEFAAAIEPVFPKGAGTVEKVEITHSSPVQSEIIIYRAGGNDKVVLEGEQLLKIFRSDDLILEAKSKETKL